MRNADLPLYKEDELLVFLNGAPEIADLGGIELISQTDLPLLNVTLLHARIVNDESVEQAVARLGEKDGLAWVQPNFIYQLLGNSRSTGLAMHGLGEGSALLPHGLPAVSPNAKMVLIDSPVDLQHPSFDGADITQMSQFASAPPSPHGTAISEILIGTGEFGGIAAGAQLISIPAFTPIDTKDWHKPSISTTKLLVGALQRALAVQPNVVNLSFGSPTSSDPAIKGMVELLFKSGACIAAAAGNAVDDPVMFPAVLPETIAVAAVDARERSYRYGSRGEAIDIASWGVDISAAVPGGRSLVSGTSFAAPIAAGAMLRMPICTSNANPQALRGALAKDAKDLGATGKDEVFGSGLLRFGANVAANVEPPDMVSPGPTQKGGLGFSWLWIVAMLATLIGIFFAYRRRSASSDAD